MSTQKDFQHQVIIRKMPIKITMKCYCTLEHLKLERLTSQVLASVKHLNSHAAVGM